MRYSTYDPKTNEFTEVYELKDCLKAILIRNEDNENRIKKLEEENKSLKDKHFKDTEIQKLANEIVQMRIDYNRGFPIREEEHVAINEWKRNHEKEAHKNESRGTIGGGYHYCFYPTSIGTSGVIKCLCGAEFEFRKLI